MKTSNPKHYSSPFQIIQLLKDQRGMIIADEAKAERYLTNISYHRLSAYIFPFYQMPKSGLQLKGGTTFQLRKQIADYFGVKPKVFVSWLTVLANLRNMCCHHARVWNREFALKPTEALRLRGAWIDTSKLDNKRVYYRLCIIKYLLNIISPNNDMCDKLNHLFAEYPQIDLFAMGFPIDWDKEQLWQ